MDGSRLRQVLGFSPFRVPDTAHVASVSRAGGLGVLSLHADSGAAAALSALDAAKIPYLLDLTDYDAPTLHAGVSADCPLLLTDRQAAAGWGRDRWFMVLVTSERDARAAEAAGAKALLARGNEAGGEVGQETSFVLLQRLVKATTLPIWLQGGIGVNTAAAARVGGAAGVALDIAFGLATDIDLSEPIRALLNASDGSESMLSDDEGEPYRTLERGGESVARDLAFSGRSSGRPVPWGQDAPLAKGLAASFGTVAGIARGILDAFESGPARAASMSPAALERIAADHGTATGVLQGPMTRVSDRAEFAGAVAEGGGLPFLALALMRGPEVRRLLVETQARLGERPFGVGILGFVPPELRTEQLDEVLAIRPAFALIAGGRPSQARPLEAAGIKVYLHVPSPGLLDLYLKDGARRFVFEGRECGGHVGPRSSFVLWEQQVERLVASKADLSDVSVVFAGGIHDARSSAMVMAIAAPLATRGARVGVLMGTAYLFTEEAVSSGAIGPVFQASAVECQDTALVETAPGHATRCAESPFVQAFRAERARLVADGLPKDAIWASLEEMNLGRLRIASKGLVRRGAEVVPVSADEQRQEGMFMIGQVAVLRDSVTRVADLHQNVTRDAVAHLGRYAAAQPTAPDATLPPLDVAIIGMACMLPGAPDLDTYWSNVVLGQNSVGLVPAERWNVETYYDPNSQDGTKTPSKWGGFLSPTLFDPLEYGIPPRSLASIEPSQILALETARRALEDAGYAADAGREPHRSGLRAFDRERTSVMFGAESGTDLGGAYGFRFLWPQLLGELPPELDAILPKTTEDSFPGVLANVIAGRIANRLNLGGANYTVDAACASSLAAVDVAVKSLLAGESAMALAGGVDLHNAIGDYLLFSSVHALSKTGQCRTFDSRADGIALGEGVGVVVLKRLADAERDGDRVYAVIRGIGASSDGKSLGLTAPRKEGQQRAVARAMARAGISPRDVGLVEAHGTGTVVGDKTELATLTEAYLEGGANPGSITLGSVKSNIGHTKCAAGLAGLIKAALAVHHGVLPPTLNLESPNPYWRRDQSPFVFQATSRPWLSANRVAALSAFGFGGTNFHLVMGGDPVTRKPRVTLPHYPVELAAFSAASLPALRDRAKALAAIVKKADPLCVSLTDVAAAITASARIDGPSALVSAGSLGQLAERLDAFAAGGTPVGVAVKEAGASAKVAFLFPGQGSQRPGMFSDLFVNWPHLRSVVPPEWASLLFPEAAFDEGHRSAQKSAITDTRAAQPTLGMAGLAGAMLLREFGVLPDLLGGHSYGEVVALTVAGALPASELVSLSRARADAIIDAVAAIAASSDGTTADAGTMAAVGADAGPVRAILDGLGPNAGVVVANVNAPGQTVISGTTAGVAAAAKALTAAGYVARPIPVACAFHSPVIAGASARFERVLADVPVGALTGVVYGNASAAPYPTEPAAIVQTLAAQLESPVEFVKQIEAMAAAGATIFVEVGPGRVLSGLVRKILGRQTQVVSLGPGDGHGLVELADALLALHAAGVTVDARAWFRGRSPQKVAIDALPVRKASAWIVDGQRAVPVVGEPPKGGLQLVREPIRLASTAASVAPQEGDSREQVVLEYLSSLQRIVDTQRDVMLGFLGAPAAPAVQTAAPHAPPTRARTAEPPPSGPVVPTAVTVATRPSAAISVASTLVALVAERTGYPPEMLTLDLDLEADLSIDSIKRLEILGALSERLALGEGDEATRDALIETLATKKTIRGIAEILDAEATRAPALSAAPVTRALPTVTPAPLVPASVMPASVASRPTGSVLIALTGLVSERTGYPTDVLLPDLDLEADLSIDSIKRLEIIGALAEILGFDGSGPDGESGRDAMVEALAAKKTLRGIADWLEDAAGHKAAPTPALPAVQATLPAPVAAGAPDRAALTTGLVALIAERTGYPAEVLTLDLDLEADLSIDSIKRLEIIGALSEGLGLTGDLDARDQLVESLAAKKTIRAILDTLLAPALPAVAGNAPVRTSDVTRVETSSTATKSDDPLRLRRYVVASAALPAPKANGSTKARLTPLRVALQGVDPGIEVPLTAALAAVPAIVMPSSDEPVDVVIDFTAMTGDAPQVFEAVRARLPKGLLLLVGRRDSGIAGFAKTLARELAPLTTRAFTIDDGPPQGEELTVAVTSAVRAWAEHPERMTPAHVHLGGRGAGRSELSEVAIRPGSLSLGPKSRVLVTGGARGITAGLVKALAPSGATFILVGRSPLPTLSDIPPEAEGSTSEAELRRALVLTGRYETLKSVENEVKRITGAREILANVDAIRVAGGLVEYHALDVSDDAGFRRLLGETLAAGPLALVVHGAGVLEDRRFGDKTRDSFDRVFKTKVNAARTLVATLPKSTALVFFSSIASTFGNAGQVDYASANDVLDALAEARSASGAPTLSLAFGPWGSGDGIRGMVSPELEREYARRGIGLIDVRDGTRATVAEIAALVSGTATSPRVVLMAAAKELFEAAGASAR